MIRFIVALGGTLFLFTLVYGLHLVLIVMTNESPNTAPTPVYVISPLPENPKGVATVVVGASTSTAEETPGMIPILPEPPPRLTPYIEITTGCSVTVTSDCVTAHRLPDAESAIRASLRVGTVLLIGDATTSPDGTRWYEVLFDEPIRYPERLARPWYIRADAGTIHYETGIEELSTTTPTTTKSLLVDRGDQKLYAYEDDTLVRTYTISTGLELSPTPRGTFTIYRKTPTRYMQGPIPGINTKYYDLPGVPWNLYFTQQGAVVHGAYWHNSFGSQYSSGCVNVDPTEAYELYQWAELGMTITVRD